MNKTWVRTSVFGHRFAEVEVERHLLHGSCKCLFAINRVANSAYAVSARANFSQKFMTTQGRCVRLGIVLAQPRGYPQKKTGAVFCPRSRDNGKRDRCTGLAHLQVRAAVGKNAVVHIPCRLLLLRLCIYKEDKKKTEGQLGAHPRAGVVIWTGRCLGGARDRTPGRKTQPSTVQWPETARRSGKHGAVQAVYAAAGRRKAPRRSADRGRLKR